MWFGIVTNPNKQWDHVVITDILMACVVLYNMTIKDEQNLNLEQLFDMKINITFKSRLSFED
jgi:hypothetical protein